MVAPFLSIPKDQLSIMLISAIVVEKFGMAPIPVVIKDAHDCRFHESTHNELLRHFRNTRYWSQFLLNVNHWFPSGQGGHVSHFPDGRKMLFGVRGVQDFHDGIGSQITVFFQQPVGYSVQSTGLP